MLLIRALRYQVPACLAFVGAGGKTTALFKAGRELLASENDHANNRTILLTTTTHLGDWQTGEAGHWYIINSQDEITGIGKALPSGIVLLTGVREGNRLRGLSTELIQAVHQLATEHNIPLLIEADGSRLLPLKAPALHEPVIPQFVDGVVVVAGLQGLGKPAKASWIHRPELFTELAGINYGEVVTGEALAKVLLSEAGGLKGIPERARRIVLLNQADELETLIEAQAMAEKLIAGYDSVIISALNPQPSEVGDYKNGVFRTESNIFSVIEHTAGIILAAGKSSRFGQPKQLLMWKAQPLVRHVAQAAIAAGLEPVVVVLGAYANEIRATIEDLPLRIVINHEWTGGLSSSIKAGLHALPQNTGGAIFFQADQPQIPPKLVMSLVDTHRANLHPIIAPLIHGQRGNPVLFDATIFTELTKLEGDIGGRALFQQHPPHWLEWMDEKCLLDIDSPEDYQKLLTY